MNAGAVAQLGERLDGIQKVEGSTPFGSITQILAWPGALTGQLKSIRLTWVQYNLVGYKCIGEGQSRNDGHGPSIYLSKTPGGVDIV